MNPRCEQWAAILSLSATYSEQFDDPGFRELCMTPDKFLIK